MKKTKIGIVGCGGIGSGVAWFVDKKLRGQACLGAVCDLDKKRVQGLRSRLGRRVRVLDCDALVRAVDLVVEAASGPAARQVLKKAIAYKKDVVILSVGGLMPERSLLRRAAARGIKVYLPSGAVAGLDALGALSLGTIKKVRLTTSKPPRGLAGADYLKKKKINLNNLKKAKVIFRGGVKEATRHFPKNINVAATLLLTSGCRDIEVVICADPQIKRNTHSIEIEAGEAVLNLTVGNVPSLANPKTSTLAILSAQYMLKKILSPLKLGT